MKQPRPVALALLTAALAVAPTFLGAAPAPEGKTVDRADYKSPYEFVAAVKDPALTSDFNQPPKRDQDSHEWSQTPYAEWTNFRAIENLHSTWGPIYRHFLAPQGALEKDAAWAESRVLAAANRVRGAVPYAHHHMHVWNVPDTAEWTNAHYTPGVGFDCSDFTHWAYSYGLGIELKTGIAEQAEMKSAPMHLADGQVAEVEGQHLYDVHNGFSQKYEDIVKVLQPGDLLYIRGNPGLENKITHVIMWLGNLATDTNHKDEHLVMDSHGAVVVDSNGVIIPSGPQIRPFRPNSYYSNSFDHIVRYAPIKKSGAAAPAARGPRRGAN